MRIKVLVAKGLLVALPLALIPALANSAPKITPGAKCKVLNQKVPFQNKTYTCKKSGNKLVWNRGEVVVKKMPTQTNSDSQKTIAVDKWQEVQFTLLKKLLLLKPAETQKLEFVLSPNVNKKAAEKLQNSYQEPISLLSNLFVNPSPVTFLVMDENDRDWWWDKSSALSETMDASWWGGSHCKPNPKSHCGYGTSPNADGTFHFGQLLGSKFVWKDEDFAIAYHESIHVYQLGLLGARIKDLPPWFAEGQASYLGPTFSHKYQNSKDQREGPLRGLKSSFPETSKYSLSEWITWLKRLDSDYDFTFNNGLGYSAGALIMESLYNIHDYTKIHDWMVAIKNGKSYKDGFKDVFEQDYDNWIETVVAPYVDSQI